MPPGLHSHPSSRRSLLSHLAPNGSLNLSATVQPPYPMGPLSAANLFVVLIHRLYTPTILNWLHHIPISMRSFNLLCYRLQTTCLPYSLARGAVGQYNLCVRDMTP